MLEIVCLRLIIFLKNLISICRANKKNLNYGLNAGPPLFQTNKVTGDVEKTTLRERNLAVLDLLSYKEKNGWHNQKYIFTQWILKKIQG